MPRNLTSALLLLAALTSAAESRAEPATSDSISAPRVLELELENQPSSSTSSRPPARPSGNCVDRHKLKPGDTARPCWDVGAIFARFESWATEGRTGLRIDTRITGPRMAFRTNGETIDDPGPHGGFALDFGTREILNLGDGDYNLYHVAGLRYQQDADLWGWYLGGFTVAKWHERYRIITPTAGLRIGRFDQAALIAEAKLTGLYLYARSEDGRSLTRDFDVDLRATVALRPYLRLESRGRLRNITIDEEMRQSDAMVAFGLAGAITDKMGFQVIPSFIGLGFRYVSSHDEWKYHPVKEREVFIPVEPEGIQLMLLLDLNLGLNSTAQVW